MLEINIGATVESRGREVGRVERVVLNRDTYEASHLVVKHGGLLHPRHLLMPFDWVVGSEHDRVRIDRADDESYSRAFALEALERGDRCFGVFEDGRLLWYCWYARAAAPIFDDVDATADFPYLYVYNAHTDPAHRGRGLHRIGSESSARFFAAEGYRAFTAYIEVLNLAALIAARKMRERAEGLVVLYRSARGVRWIASPGCRKAAFRVRRRPADGGLRRPADEDGRAPARTGAAPARRSADAHPHP